MKNKLSIFIVIWMLSTLVVGACGPAGSGESASEPSTINVVEQAGLSGTVAIEIAELDTASSAEVGTLYTYQLTVDDQAQVEQAVITLDVDLEPDPPARCSSLYELRFRLEDGTTQVFGYSCGAEGPAFLRGDQAFWGGQQVTAPAGFDAWVREQLASAAPVEPVPVPNPAMARDAALAYLAKAYIGQAPASDQEWAEKPTTAEELVGSSSFQYTAGDWVISISFPVVAPEATIYQVQVTNEATGFQWEGEVNAEGKVSELAGPEGQEQAPPQANSDDLAALAQGNSAFAFDLYQVLREQDGNLFYSPYSISLALAMTYAGARGETEAQMADALHFTLSQAQLPPAFRDLTLALASRGEGAEGKDGEGFRLNIANALWGQEGYQFLDEFLAVLDDNYGAGMRLVDFVGAPEDSRVAINDWVSDETEGRIENLIPQGVINALTRLVLTNAIYFNAAWEEPFQEEATRDGTFYLLDGSEVTVPMMRQTTSFLYAAGKGYQAVELPYDGHQLSMVILLPEAGTFEDFQGALDARQVDAIVQDLTRQQVALAMPQFEFESEFSLNEALAALGMPLAFTGGADFSGMTGNRDLFISAVIHKAFVSVDEAGTEAAAATAVVMELTAAPAEPVQVTLDRPFIFFIRDIETGAILFLGRIVDPSA
jgi:serpin B